MRTDRHHKLPRCFGGTRNHNNLSKVDKKKHSMFHQLFSKDGYAMTSQEIADELNNVWCDPSIRFVIQER